MPTTSTTSRVDPRQILALADSVAAHVAAKLACFGSDERTLTEELCDMMYIWARAAPRVTIRVGSVPLFDLTITKVSQREEIRTGADLELVVTSPLGTKRALVQAKVLDPADLTLRCDSTRGWAKLRTQLKSAHAIAPGLTFLMVYVPDGELNGDRFVYSTWEQGFFAPSGTGISTRYGASFFAAEDLLSTNYRWRYRDKLRYDGGGRFRLASLSLSELLLDMLVCSRGSWISRSVDEVHYETTQDQPAARVSLRVGTSGVNRGEWEVVVSYLRQLRSGGEDSQPTT